MTVRRIPGPLCATTSPPIDEGTMCRSTSYPPGPIGLSVDELGHAFGEMDEVCRYCWASLGLLGQLRFDAERCVWLLRRLPADTPSLVTWEGRRASSVPGSPLSRESVPRRHSERFLKRKDSWGTLCVPISRQSLLGPKRLGLDRPRHSRTFRGTAWASAFFAVPTQFRT